MTLNLKEAGCGEHTNPRTNLWSDEQKSHIRFCMRVRLHNKSKPDNYTESCGIDVADAALEAGEFDNNSIYRRFLCACCGDTSENRYPTLKTYCILSLCNIK